MSVFVCVCICLCEGLFLQTSDLCNTKGCFAFQSFHPSSKNTIRCEPVLKHQQSSYHKVAERPDERKEPIRTATNNSAALNPREPHLGSASGNISMDMSWPYLEPTFLGWADGFAISPWLDCISPQLRIRDTLAFVFPPCFWPCSSPCLGHRFQFGSKLLEELMGFEGRESLFGIFAFNLAPSIQNPSVLRAPGRARPPRSGCWTAWATPPQAQIGSERSGDQTQTMGCGSKPMVPYWGSILVHFSGDWDVHRRYGILTHGQFKYQK